MAATSNKQIIIYSHSRYTETPLCFTWQLLHHSILFHTNKIQCNAAHKYITTERNSSVQLNNRAAGLIVLTRRLTRLSINRVKIFNRALIVNFSASHFRCKSSDNSDWSAKSVDHSNAYACVIKCLLTERIKPDVTYGVVFRHLRVVVKIVKWTE